MTMDMHFTSCLIQTQLNFNTRKETSFLCALGQIAVIIPL